MYFVCFFLGFCYRSNFQNGLLLFGLCVGVKTFLFEHKKALTLYGKGFLCISALQILIPLTSSLQTRTREVGTLPIYLSIHQSYLSCEGNKSNPTTLIFEFLFSIAITNEAGTNFKGISVLEFNLVSLLFR